MGTGCGRSSNDQFAFKPVFTDAARPLHAHAWRGRKNGTNPVNFPVQNPRGKYSIHPMWAREVGPEGRRLLEERRIYACVLFNPQR